MLRLQLTGAHTIQSICTCTLYRTCTCFGQSLEVMTAIAHTHTHTIFTNLTCQYRGEDLTYQVFLETLYNALLITRDVVQHAMNPRWRLSIQVRQQPTHSQMGIPYCNGLKYKTYTSQGYQLTRTKVLNLSCLPALACAMSLYIHKYMYHISNLWL